VVQSLTVLFDPRVRPERGGSPGRSPRLPKP